jgi:hypothetical protein
MDTLLEVIDIMLETHFRFRSFQMILLLDIAVLNGVDRS